MRALDHPAHEGVLGVEKDRCVKGRTLPCLRQHSAKRSNNRSRQRGFFVGLEAGQDFRYKNRLLAVSLRTFKEYAVL